MIVEIDTRAKKVAVLQWLKQGFIDTHDIEEMGKPEIGIPVARWLDKEREGDTGKTVEQWISEEMGVLL